MRTQIDHPGLNWNAPFTLKVASLEQPYRYTVVYHLKSPNSRFASLFIVRWTAAWIMPKHVFEKVENPLAFDNNPPVSLGAYVLNSYDKAGAIWKLRNDWRCTSIGMMAFTAASCAMSAAVGPRDGTGRRARRKQPPRWTKWSRSAWSPLDRSGSSPRTGRSRRQISRLVGSGPPTGIS